MHSEVLNPKIWKIRKHALSLVKLQCKQNDFLQKFKKLFRMELQFSNDFGKT